MLHSSVVPNICQNVPKKTNLGNVGRHRQIIYEHTHKTNIMCKYTTYRDHADSDELDNEKLPVKTKGGVYIPFPEKLFNMLQFIDLHECELAKIVSWQPHGRCFRVHDKPRFESIVLPRFFTHQKNASFLRQLNLWNFKRIYKDPRDRGAYYHEFFLRSKKFLHRNISRRNGKEKGTTHSSRSSGVCQSSSDNDCEPIFVP